jgi:hypothetical protein
MCFWKTWTQNICSVTDIIDLCSIPGCRQYQRFHRRTGTSKGACKAGTLYSSSFGSCGLSDRWQESPECQQWRSSYAANYCHRMCCHLSHSCFCVYHSGESFRSSSLCTSLVWTCRRDRQRDSQRACIVASKHAGCPAFTWWSGCDFPDSNSSIMKHAESHLSINSGHGCWHVLMLVFNRFHRPTFFPHSDWSMWLHFGLTWLKALVSSQFMCHTCNWSKHLCAYSLVTSSTCLKHVVTFLYADYCTAVMLSSICSSIFIQFRYNLSSSLLCDDILLDEILWSCMSVKE